MSQKQPKRPMLTVPVHLADRERLVALAEEADQPLSEWIRQAIDLQLAMSDQPLLQPVHRGGRSHGGRAAERTAATANQPKGKRLTRAEHAVADMQPPRRRHHWLDDVDPGDVSVWPSGASPAAAEYASVDVRSPQRFGPQAIPWKRGTDR